MKRKSKIARKGRTRGRRHVSVKAPPYIGDHGTGTQAAMAGTFLEAVPDDANNMGRRRRVDALDVIISRELLTMTQEQAARAIRDAYTRTEALSSGGPLKEWVQSSPKPDAAVSAQVDANSNWAHIIKPITRAERDLVRHICCFGLPARTAPNPRRAMANLRTALDKVALHLGYVHPADTKNLQCIAV